MQQLTLRSMTNAVMVAQQIGSWIECSGCGVCETGAFRGILVYRNGQRFAHIKVVTPLDDRRANRRMVDAAR